MNLPFGGRPALPLVTRSSHGKRPTSGSAPIFAAGLVASCLLSLSLPSVAHSCEQWSVQGAGTLTLVQSNGATPVFSLAQAGTKFSGSALYSPEKPGGSVGGEVDGSITGKFFSLTVRWKDNKTGVYTGTIGNDGQIAGKTYQAGHASSQASWYSTSILRCLTHAEADFCVDYANKAVAATEESRRIGCDGIDPPRWSTRADDHVDWCMYHQEMANREAAARASAVESCRQQKIAAQPSAPKPVDPMDRLGVTNKPQKGIGQILQETQPVDPLDKRGVLNRP